MTRRDGGDYGVAKKTFDIMVDYDDVVVPWAWKVHEAAGEMGLHDGTALWRSWHMWEDYGCTEEQWGQAVRKATEDGLYTDTDPFPLAAEALRRLHFMGHRIHIVTARGTSWGSPESREQIRNWTVSHVAKFGIPHVSLSFCGIKSQAQQALGVEFDFAIDDSAKNYIELEQAGVPVWLCTQPHNLTVDGVRRVPNLWSFAEMVVQESFS